MPGFRSKKLITKRHADDVTVADLIRLRKENEELKKQMEETADVVADLRDEIKWLWEVLSLHRLTFNLYANYNPDAKFPELIYPKRPEKRRPELELKEDPKWKALK